MEVIRSFRRPLIVSGGGTIYSEATDALRALADATGIPVGGTYIGKGSPVLRPSVHVGAVGASGNTAANALAREADVVIGIGTRYSDFTTASPHSYSVHPASGSSTSTWASFDAAETRRDHGPSADAVAALVALTDALLAGR